MLRRSTYGSHVELKRCNNRLKPKRPVAKWHHDVWSGQSVIQIDRRPSSKQSIPKITKIAGDLMYPISQGYAEVNARLDALARNGHYAEALLATVFAMEKTIRRSLRFCVLNRGFTSKHCDNLLKNKGFQDMNALWPIFEKEHRTLPEFVGQNVWQHVPEAVRMRNKMVHGASVFKLADCRDTATNVRTAMGALRARSMSDLNCDPWERLPGKRKSSLPWLGTSGPKSRSS